MTNPTVLVTGARGFIGQSLVQRLVNENTHCRVLTRDKKNGVAYAADRLIDTWQGDLTQLNTLEGIASGIHTVYHLAGEISDGALYDRVNRQGTSNLLTVCGRAEVRKFVYLSSVGVMGGRATAETLDEDSPAQPGNDYEVSKFSGEQLALGFRDSATMSVSVLRPSIVYGEGYRNHGDSFLAWLKLIASRRYRSLGHGYISSYVYVGDVVAACMKLADASQVDSGVYIVNEPIELDAFVGEIASIMQIPIPKTLPEPVRAFTESLLRRTGRFASLYNRSVFSMEKLATKGFVLPFGYRVGLRRTISWYQEKGMLNVRQ